VVASIGRQWEQDVRSAVLAGIDIRFEHGGREVDLKAAHGSHMVAAAEANFLDQTLAPGRGVIDQIQEETRTLREVDPILARFSLSQHGPNIATR